MDYTLRSEQKKNKDDRFSSLVSFFESNKHFGAKLDKTLDFLSENNLSFKEKKRIVIESVVDFVFIDTTALPKWDSMTYGEKIGNYVDSVSMFFCVDFNRLMNLLDHIYAYEDGFELYALKLKDLEQELEQIAQEATKDLDIPENNVYFISKEESVRILEDKNSAFVCVYRPKKYI